MSLATALRRRRLLAMASDPAVDYAGFAKPDDLMRKIDLGWATIAGILCSKVVMQQGKEGWIAGNRYADRMRDVGIAAEEARKLSEVDHVLEQGEQGLTLQISFPRIRCYVPALPSQPTSEQSGAHARSRAVLRNLLPGLDFDRIGEAGDRRRGLFELKDAAAREIPLEALGAINVDEVPKLDLQDWQVPLRGSVRYRIVPSDINTDVFTDRITEHTGMTISVAVVAKITLPMEYCRWAQHAESDAEFVPLASWLHFQAQRDWSTGKFSVFDEDSGRKPPSEPPMRVPHPDAVAQHAARAVSTYGITAHKMTDDHDVCVLPNGKVLYVPTVPGASVSGMMRECVKNGEIDLNVIHDRHVFTDWVIHKMGVSDGEGQLHLVDLTGARPPSKQVVAHLADHRIRSEMLGNMMSLGRRLGVRFDDVSVLGDVEEADVRWNNLIDVPLVDDDEDPRNARAFVIGNQLGALYSKLELSDVPLWEQYEVRPWLALFGPYRSVRSEGVRLLGDQTAHNRSGIDPTVVPELHNMPGVEGVMPHQRRVCGALALEPEGAILDVRAGGGKSLASIFDVCHLMAAGKVRRPVMIMPRNLLANYATEVVRFTGGRVRPFLISNSVWRGFIRRFGSNPQALLDLLKSQPVNTLFLVDYGWLMHNAQRVELGGDTTDFFPHATMLLELRPDYCCLDESHKAKKIAAGRSLAASVITGMAKYRRIMSGTIFHNTAADLVGQMAQIEPTALGDLGEEIRTNRRVSVSELPMLEKAKSAFARTISVPRKEWAHLLPPLVERVHICEMTPLQRKFYNQIYERLQQDILKDPKLQKLLKKLRDDPDKPDPQAEARMTAVLRRKFLPLEQWLNAPDSEFSDTQFGHVFAKLEGVGPNDLASPKIEVLDRLLDEHLRGGPVVLDDGEEVVPPDGNKAIIFCFNKAVTEHVFAHSRHAGLGVKYQQGDDAALERFKNDPEVLFLYASVTSMAEGHNLQMASRVVTMQSYWTPGLGEQALARVWRPDVPDKNGEVKYRRERIWSDQIVIEPSVEVAKLARLIAKQVTNLLAEEYDSSLTLRNMVKNEAATFDRITPFKMTLDNLKKYQDQRSLNTYFRAYAITKSWERREFKEARDRVRAEIEQRVGRRVSNSEISSLSMTRPTNVDTPEFNVPLAIQAHGFVPWAEGFTGYNPTGLKLVPLAMPKPSDDDEDEDTSEADDEDGTDDDDGIVVERDDPVWTELGPGRISSARKGAKMLWVQVPGFRDAPVKLWRYGVLAASNPVDKRALDIIVRRAAERGLPTLKLGANGELMPQSNALPQGNVAQVLREATTAVRENVPAVPLQVPGRAPPRPVPTGRVATRADLTRERGRITIGNHEAVLLRHNKTGVPAWIVRHVTDARDRAPPFPSAQKRMAVDELLRRHNEASKTPVAGRSPGIRPNDPNVAPSPRGGKSSAQPATRVGRVADPSTPGTNRGGKSSVVRPASRTLSLTDIESHEEERDVRVGDAGLFSGTVCLVTTDGGDRDELLAQSGFDRIARRLDILVKNPRAYRALMQLLFSKFDVPDANQKAMTQFADQFQAARAQVAYLKAKELPQHSLWVRQQRTRAKTDTTIMPWPLVRNGKVYVVINQEQLKTKAVNMLKRLTYPVGTMRPVTQPPQMIAMLRSVTNAKQLMRQLKQHGVDFENEKDIVVQLQKIKG